MAQAVGFEPIGGEWPSLEQFLRARVVASDLATKARTRRTELRPTAD